MSRLLCPRCGKNTIVLETMIVTRKAIELSGEQPVYDSSRIYTNEDSAFKCNDCGYTAHDLTFFTVWK